MDRRCKEVHAFDNMAPIRGPRNGLGEQATQNQSEPTRMRARIGQFHTLCTLASGDNGIFGSERDSLRERDHKRPNWSNGLRLDTVAGESAGPVRMAKLEASVIVASMRNGERPLCKRPGREKARLE